MTSRRIPLAICALLALAGMPAQAGAQAADHGGPTAAAGGVPKRTQAAVRSALTQICASPDAYDALMRLVQAHDSAKVRAMLIQYGVPSDQLRNITVDAAGVSKGARKLASSTIYFDVIPPGGNVPTPVGLVYIGGHWVDWNEYEASWYWWW